MDVTKGILAGVAGGLIASWVMSQFQDVWPELTGDYQPGDKHSGQGQHAKHESEPGSAKAADAVARLVGRPLDREERTVGGRVVHYAFGAAGGAAYGAIAERTGGNLAGGLMLGAAIWALGDEFLVPVFGLSKSPAEKPLETHVYSLGSHLVYGLTTEVVRRMIRD